MVDCCSRPLGKKDWLTLPTAGTQGITLVAGRRGRSGSWSVCLCLYAKLRSVSSGHLSVSALPVNIPQARGSMTLNSKVKTMIGCQRPRKGRVPYFSVFNAIFFPAFLLGGPTFSFCTEPHKLYSQICPEWAFLKHKGHQVLEILKQNLSTLITYVRIFKGSSFSPIPFTE